jgi:hypothetical protein
VALFASWSGKASCTSTVRREASSSTARPLASDDPRRDGVPPPAAHRGHDALHLRLDAREPRCPALDLRLLHLLGTQRDVAIVGVQGAPPLELDALRGERSPDRARIGCERAPQREDVSFAKQWPGCRAAPRAAPTS